MVRKPPTRVETSNLQSTGRLSDDRIGLANITNRPKRSCRQISNFRTMESTSNDEIAGPPPPKTKKVDDAETGSEIHSFGKKLINILGLHYFDLKDRLQLTVEPKCMLYVEACSKQHSKNKPPKVCDINIPFESVTLLPTKFVQSLSGMLLQSEFPGDTMILSLLELILIITKTAQQTLAESLNVLTDILIQFPPCWPALKEQYLSVLSNQLPSDAVFSEKYIDSPSIFAFMLQTLEYLMENDDEDGRSKRSKKSLVRKDSDVFNFFQWEAKRLSNQNFLFDKFSREEKLNRIFMVLSFLVDLLEKDLVMWIMKHPNKVAETMESNRKRPLIAHMMWSDPQETGHLTVTVKKIIKIFINSVMLKFPGTSIDILGRLFNLMAVSVNLSENQYNDDFMYPFVKSKSEALVKELGRQAESSSYYCVDSALSLLDAISTPYVRMLLVDYICNKLYPHQGTPSVYKFWQNFQCKLWLTYDVEPAGDSSEVSSSGDTDKYPVLAETRWVVRKLAFDQSQYLRLLLTGIKAYFSLYRLNDVIKANRKQKTQQEGPSIVVVTPPLVKLPTMPSMVFVGLTVDVNVMLYYRDELKYYLLLKQLIADYKVKFGSMFNDLDEFMSQCMET